MLEKEKLRIRVHGQVWLLIFFLFTFCYFYLMPTINKQNKKNNPKFKILHISSIAINIFQILILISITVLLLDF